MIAQALGDRSAAVARRSMTDDAHGDAVRSIRSLDPVGWMAYPRDAMSSYLWNSGKAPTVGSW